MRCSISACSGRAGSSSSRTSPSFDHNGDGRVDDGDLLFAVTLRSGKPDQDLVIPDADNHYLAAFVQDDWRVRSGPDAQSGPALRGRHRRQEHPRVGEINPLVRPFLQGERASATSTTSDRASGSTGRPADGRTSVHGGYGIYYDRVTLQIQSLERGLDGRALPIEVRAGNVFFLDPTTGQFPPFAPSTAESVHGLHPARRRARPASTSSTTACRTPSVQQFNLGVQHELPGRVVLRVDGVHNLGTHFIIGRTVGEVFNPVVGGPDRVVNLESSVNTQIRRAARQRRGAHARAADSVRRTRSSKAFNYSNDDQIPFGSGPDRPERTCSSSTDRRPTTSGTG